MSTAIELAIALPTSSVSSNAISSRVLANQLGETKQHVFLRSLGVAPDPDSKHGRAATTARSMSPPRIPRPRQNLPIDRNDFFEGFAGEPTT